MNTRPPRFDPARLDMAAFSEAGAELSGHLPLARLPRLAESTLAPADGAAGAEMAWSAQGRQRDQVGRPPEISLTLRAKGSVWLACQRCLEPLRHELAVDRRFLFVVGEDEAAELDEESEDDVLALERSFDLLALLEDELILALPLVPRHDRCPRDSLQPAPAAAVEASERPNPFAALAALKRGGGGQGGAPPAGA